MHPDLHIDIDTRPHALARLDEGLDAAIALARDVDPSLYSQRLGANRVVAVGGEVHRHMRDPAQLAKVARELSSASGLVVFSIGIEHGAAVHYIAFERGRVMDEYNSVPELAGPLPPGDAIALRANPTVVARLTGANAASVRATARSVSSPDELPPAEELIREIAEVIGLEGAHYTVEDAANLPDAIAVEHE